MKVNDKNLPDMSVMEFGRYKKAGLKLPSPGNLQTGFFQLFFCYMFKSLIHDGCHMAVCQGVENRFSVSAELDQ